MRIGLGLLGICAGMIAFGAVGESASAQTLAAVKKRGQLVCGVNGNLPPFSYTNEKKERLGFDADFCRAVAAAVLGDATKVNFVALPIAKRFEALKSGEVDLLARHSAITMERTAGQGVRAAAVTYIDGQAFVVPRRINVSSLTGLDKKTLCATKDSPHQNNAESWMALRGLAITTQVFDNQDAMYEAFFAGKCDAVTQEATIVAMTVISTGKAADFLMLPEIISSEPLGPYVKSGDDQWYDIVHWTFNAMVQAEEYAVSSSNVDDQRNSKDPTIRRLLGVDPGNGKMLGLDESWGYNVIKQVGNYAEMYERDLGNGSALKFARGINALWRQGGVLYSAPMR